MQFFSNIDLSHYLPPVPHRFYSSAGSTFIAAGIGGAYGLIGRMLYPKAGISPLHYAVWFLIAYQIKQLALSIEKNFECFLEGEVYEKLEETLEDELLWHDLIRYHSLKVFQMKDCTIRAIDQFFSKILNIRPYDEIVEDNVEEASFIEMCRYRIWPVFKMAVLDTLSFALAHSLSNGIGFTLPDRTSVSLLIVIRSIVKDIILAPALYVYARMCNRIADDLDEGDELATTYRTDWIRWCLPKL